MASSSSAHADHGYVAASASDQALMSHIAHGDTEAFEEIYRRHSRHALSQARKLCASSELAEDVAQETFISLWRSAHRYRPGLGSVSAWLSSMVRNRAIDAWRRASVRPVEMPAYEDGAGQLRSAIGADTPAPERATVLALDRRAAGAAEGGGLPRVLRRHDARRDRRLGRRADRHDQGPHPARRPEAA